MQPPQTQSDHSPGSDNKQPPSSSSSLTTHPTRSTPPHPSLVPKRQHCLIRKFLQPRAETNTNEAKQQGGPLYTGVLSGWSARWGGEGRGALASMQANTDVAFRYTVKKTEIQLQRCDFLILFYVNLFSYYYFFYRD